MQLVQHVTAKQQRGRFLRSDRLEARGRLLGHLVVAGVVREACQCDEAIAKLFGGTRRRALLAQVLLQLRDVGVVARIGGGRNSAGAIEVLDVLIEGRGSTMRPRKTESARTS